VLALHPDLAAMPLHELLGLPAEPEPTAARAIARRDVAPKQAARAWPRTRPTLGLACAGL